MKTNAELIRNTFQATYDSDPQVFFRAGMVFKRVSVDDSEVTMYGYPEEIYEKNTSQIFYTTVINK